MPSQENELKEQRSLREGLTVVFGDRRDRIGLGLIAVGTGIAVLAVVNYLQLRNVINNYIEVAKDLEVAMKKYYETTDEAERQRLAQYIDSLSELLKHKEDILKSAGLINQLRGLVNSVIGLVVVSGVITAALLWYWNRKYRPPKIIYKGKEYTSEEQLYDDKVSEQTTAPNVSVYSEVAHQLSQAPEWFIELTSTLAAQAVGGVEIFKYKVTHFDELPVEEKVVVGAAMVAALVVIIVFMSWAIPAAPEIVPLVMSVA